MKLYTLLGIVALTLFLSLPASYAGSGCCPGGGDKEGKDSTEEKAD
jgi:hypothetical protein